MKLSIVNTNVITSVLLIWWIYYRESMYRLGIIRLLDLFFVGAAVTNHRVYN